MSCLDGLHDLLELGGNFVASGLGVAKKHIGVLLEEDRVLEIRVSATHGTLAEDDLHAEIVQNWCKKMKEHNFG